MSATQQIGPQAIPPIPLEHVLEAVHDGIWLFNRVEKLIYLNPVAAALAGYRAAVEAYLVNSIDLWENLDLHDEAGRLVSPEHWPHRLALRGQFTLEKVFRCRCSSRTEQWCRIKALPLRDGRGAVQYALVIAQNITQQRQTIVKVQRRDHQIRQITDAVPSMIAYIDADECHRYVNQAYAQGFERSPDTILGQPLQAVVGPVIYTQLQACLPRVFSGETVSFDLTLVTQAGHTQYKSVHFLPHCSGQHVVGFYALFNDITAHKRAVELLQDDADHLRYALEGASVGMWDWDLITQKITWSQQQEYLLGMDPGSFDGQNSTFLQCIHPEDRQRVDDHHRMAQQLREPIQLEFRVIHSNQSVHWLSSRGQVFFNAAGQPLRMAGITFDITVQRQAEIQLRHQVDRERLLAKIAQDISHGQNLPTTLRNTLEAVQVFIQVDRLILFNLHKGTQGHRNHGRVIAEAHAPGVTTMYQWRFRDPLMIQAKYVHLYRQGRVVAVNDIHAQDLPEIALGFLQYFNIQAEVIVPLLQGQQLWGLLAAHQQRPRSWQPEDVRLLNALATQISIAIERDALHQELTQANAQLQELAYLDGLTHVANRRKFDDYLRQEWRRLLRDRAPIAVIMADIDYFKAYNDIYGHQMGDDCLRRVAKVLRNAIKRPADLVARYGGEEFVVILPNTSVKGAEGVAERMRQLIRHEAIPHQGSNLDGRVTLSLGVAVAIPRSTISPEALVHHADHALYQAKHGGRDRVAVAQNLVGQWPCPEDTAENTKTAE
ncbi:MAG: diguanylate cyclase [Cyanobacteria bacterium]|nr:diguanylate cyclase [Cyanobacteriota bacterium]